MKVTFHVPYRRISGSVNIQPERHNFIWPLDWPLPRVGELLYTVDERSYRVKEICYYPENKEPHVYVILE